MPKKFTPIIGWEVRSYKTYPNYPAHLNPMLVDRHEFGNSPVRDLKSRNEFVAELRAMGFDVKLQPIYRI